MTNRLAPALLLLCAAALHARPGGRADSRPAEQGQREGKGEAEVGRGEPAVSLRRHRAARRRRRAPGCRSTSRPTARRSSSTCSGDLYTMPIGGRRGAAADLRHPLGHAAALLARRQVDRVHLRPLRRRQHLDHGARRQEPAAGHQGDLPPARTARPGRPTRSTSRRASTSRARARSARARSGSTTAPAARASR